LRRVAVTGLVVALLAGTTAAFVITEELKLERSPIGRPRFDRVFSPVCDCPQKTARLVLRLRREDTIEAVIVDEDGSPVRMLASESRRVPGRLVFRWNGRDDAGTVVPEGRYRLRVHLADERRTIVIPNRVRVDTTPPAIELVSFAPREFSPDGDGRNDAAQIAFRSSEWARPVVLVDDELAGRGRWRAGGRSELAWPGTKAGKPLSPGLYAVALQARDRAGNVSEPTTPTVVTVRYIELAGERLRVRRGGVLQFRVLTDASAFHWALRAREARRPLVTGAAATATVATRLPARVRRGRYILRVTASGHSDEAVVLVQARG
jgi:hypothetical protein